ncbi:MAG: ATP-binding protein [Proteobacteria bacterium]|nr:ATP-binding protein [Pseudomonadota bacterium]MBU1685872.1 ATP-binding protein [Pseudomonadota bacterium]
MNLTIAPNPLYNDQQTLSFGKIATLIGENGSGKSCILQAIFATKLSKNDFDDLRLVCFSSGQNENFSQGFSTYLNRERRAGRSLNLDCFYYDKTWSKLLIFLATCLYSDGRVRQFLRDGGYVDEEEVSDGRLDDISTTLHIKFKVAKQYVQRVEEALKKEETGMETDTLRSTPYFRSLMSFIATNIDPDYDFDRPLTKKAVALTSDTLFAASYSSSRPGQEDEEGEIPAQNIEDNPTVSFFTQAADNNYFIDRTNLKLILKGGLELDQLSDGEYQLLFLYALIDLFDDEKTLFLLDEADSHLHYQNIDRLWRILNSLKGQTITTTHLLDSITANDFHAIKVVEKGRIRDDDKLKQLIDRLSILSRATSVEYEVCAKIPHMALLDDYNDWDIFLLLAARKDLDISKLNSVYAFKKTSSYGSTTESFAKAKLQWAENLSKVDCALATTQVFLICDRDEAPLNIDPTTKVKVLGKEYSDRIKTIVTGKKLKVHLLAWSRREIKNYLLSHTALSHHGKLAEINSATLAQADHLAVNNPGDNDGIRRLEVKDTVDPLINNDNGLCRQKLQNYIDLIPPAEISEDIKNMYNFIVSKL